MAGKKRYVVLPSKGISGPSMQASVFQPKTKHPGQPRVSLGSTLAQSMTAKLSPFAFAANRSLEAAAPAASTLAGGIEEEDFEVQSQRFSDGPAVVAMTETARLALEASHPDLRVLPVTEYHLPGTRPRRAAKGVQPSTMPSGQSAVGADGKIFADDLKQHFLAGLADGGAAGKNVMVGLIDTGVDNAHPALAGSVTLRRCLIPGAESTVGPVDWGTDAADRAGHGTHVAGIIAGGAGHGGPAGVAPATQLVSYRVFPDNGGGPKGAENAVIIDSIRAAIEDGCHIINLSIEGASLKEDGVRSAISDAWDQGVVCIAAAGNGFGAPVAYPAALPLCVAVTAIGRDGAFPAIPDFQAHVSNQRSQVDDKIFLAAFSNYGPRVQFTAPGHAIVSTFPGGAWWFFSGTSMAAPFITGMLARLLSDNANILGMMGNADRSSAMRQMLVGRAKVLKLPQAAQEGYGLPA